VSSCIIELFKWFSLRGVYKELERRLNELGFTVSKVNPESEIYKIYKRIVSLKSGIFAEDGEPVFEEVEKIKRIIEEISKKYGLKPQLYGPYWMVGGVLGILVGFK